MRVLLLMLLSAFSLTVAAQATCTSSNAHPIDADVAFLAFWTALAIDWLAIVAIVGKRSLSLTLDRRGLDCSATEECLSFKTAPFCYDRTAKTFHTADGTTGDFKTGSYTLPDGRQGNMFSGPYPTLTSGEVTPIQTSTLPHSGAIASVPVTSTSSPSAVASPAGTSTVGKSGSGGATSTGPAAIATQGTVIVVKSEAQHAERYGKDGLGWRYFFGLMTMVELWY